MDNILAEMRSVEADLGSSEEAWPTEFAKKIDKHVSTYLINIILLVIIIIIKLYR
jgi:hypothetical protein